MESIEKLALSYVRSGRRSMGQHFLVDPEVLDRIVSEVAELRPDIVVEIGVGFGSLTRRFCAVANRVVGIEKDPKLYRIAQRRLEDLSNLELVLGDALKKDFPREAVVAGSPPYSISTDLVKKLILQGNESWILVFQKEFSHKLTASTRDPRRPYLSVLVEIAGEMSLVSDVDADSFLPPPEVDSCLVKFHFTNPYDLTRRDMRSLSDFVEVLFREHRRRKIKGALKSLGSTTELLAVWMDRRVFELHSREILEVFRSVRSAD
jgi:ribosomal RNA small subunit methyltransferase A